MNLKELASSLVAKCLNIHDIHTKQRYYYHNAHKILKSIINPPNATS